MLSDHFVRSFKRDPRVGYAPRFYRFLKSVDDGAEFLARIRPGSDRSGAAMRAGPVGLLPRAADVMHRAELQARITHDTDAGVASAQAAALMVHYFAHAHGTSADLPTFVADHVPGPWVNTWTGRVNMHGINCVHAAITAVAAHRSLERLLHACIAFGGDVDTVATIALAAASWSADYEHDLPQPLLDGLEDGPFGRTFLLDLDAKLVAFR